MSDRKPSILIVDDEPVMVGTVRIIMTSGHTETIESYITSDEIFLKKPFHIRELMEALKTAEGNSLV